MKNYILLLILLIVIIVITSSYASSVSEIECYSNSIVGDANGDGQVTPGDAQIIFDIYLGEIEEPENICCVDVNDDGQVTSGDSQLAYDIYMNNEEYEFCDNCDLQDGWYGGGDIGPGCNNQEDPSSEYRDYYYYPNQACAYDVTYTKDCNPQDGWYGGGNMHQANCGEIDDDETLEQRDYYTLGGTDVCGYTTENCETKDCDSQDGWYGGGDNPGCGTDPDLYWRDYYVDENTRTCTHTTSCQGTNPVNCDSLDVCENVCDGPYEIKGYKDFYLDTGSDSCQSSLGPLIENCAEKLSEDSDNGKDYFVQGTVIDYTDCSGGNCNYASYTDYCFYTGSSEVVVEYFADGSDYGQESHTCDYECKNGVCVDQECPDIVDPPCPGGTLIPQDPDEDGCERPPTCCGDNACEGNEDRENCNNDCKLHCTDTDGGKDYYVNGETYNEEENGTDYCESDYGLVEYYCGTDGHVLKQYAFCFNMCFDGICLEKIIDIEATMIELITEEPKEGNVVHINVTAFISTNLLYSETVMFRLYDNGELVQNSLFDTDYVTLEPNTSTTFTINWYPDSTGVHDLTVVLDPYNWIDETDESNNNRSMSVIVEQGDCPENVDILINGDAFYEGDFIELLIALYDEMGDPMPNHRIYLETTVITPNYNYTAISPMSTNDDGIFVLMNDTLLLVYYESSYTITVFSNMTDCEYVSNSKSFVLMTSPLSWVVNYNDDIFWGEPFDVIIEYSKKVDDILENVSVNVDCIKSCTGTNSKTLLIEKDNGIIRLTGFMADENIAYAHVNITVSYSYNGREFVNSRIVYLNLKDPIIKERLILNDIEGFVYEYSYVYENIWSNITTYTAQYSKDGQQYYMNVEEYQTEGEANEKLAKMIKNQGSFSEEIIDDQRVYLLKSDYQTNYFWISDNFIINLWYFVPTLPATVKLGRISGVEVVPEEVVEAITKRTPEIQAEGATEAAVESLFSLTGMITGFAADSAELEEPIPIVSAYLKKYESGIESMTEEDILDIVLSLEVLKVKFIDAGFICLEIADYYDSIGYDESVEKFRVISGMFDDMVEDIDDIKLFISENLDDIITIKDELKEMIAELRLSIKEILRVIVSS